MASCHGYREADWGKKQKCKEINTYSNECFFSVFEVPFRSSCHSPLDLRHQNAWGHRFSHHTLTGSCWLSLLMLSGLHKKWYKMQVWWLKSICSSALELLTVTMQLYFKAEPFCFSPFPLKPVIMMSPTCQPYRGRIEECAVAFISNGREIVLLVRDTLRYADVLKIQACDLGGWQTM